ncbi:MAG: winged helix-turn-helix domain-containing protein [Rhodospirillales bacterium]
MTSPARVARIAALLGDPGRSAMLFALVDGRALTARELAEVAGVTPQTASGHLGQLLDGQVVSVTSQGRHRYYRLAGPEAAGLLESLMQFSGADAERPGRRLTVGPRDPALRAYRSCYDHLAGGLAVALADRLVAQGRIELSEDGGFVTEAGVAFFGELGLDLAVPRKRTSRPLCRPCLDWSERRPHLAGRLGAALLDFYLQRRWLRRSEVPRCLTLTRAGEAGFKRVFGVDPC